MNWLLIGTAPSVLDTLPRVRAEWQIDRTITTNRGILIEPNPDVYVLIDHTACRNHRNDSIRAKWQGTHLVTMARGEQAIKDRGLDHFHEFITEGDKLTRSTWGPFRYSGQFCLAYACKNGANTVIMVGCDGYRPDDTPDYFDGYMPEKRKVLTRDYLYQHQTVQVMQPAFTEVARVYSDVRFVRYGDPCFSVSAGNWEDVKWPLQSSRQEAGARESHGRISSESAANR